MNIFVCSYISLFLILSVFVWELMWIGKPGVAEHGVRNISTYSFHVLREIYECKFTYAVSGEKGEFNSFILSLTCMTYM